MNDDRVIANSAVFPFDITVGIDVVLAGRNYVGSGIMLGPSHVLTAGHVVYISPHVATGARVTLAAGVPALTDRASVPLPSMNATAAPLFPENYNTSPVQLNDIALLTLSAPLLTTPQEAIGMVVFLDPSDIVGKPISTAGFPAGSASPQPNGQTLYRASGTVHSTEGGGLFGTDVRMTYSESVDTQKGQSGSGVWYDGALFGETVQLVAATHTSGYNDVTLIADGTQSGRLITKAVYDDIVAQMLADSGDGDAATLPENTIVGSNPGFFSFITGSGDDYIEGSYRRERIIGQDGEDRLLGGGANDRLEGGGGVDQALFSDLFTNYDFVITDPSNPAFEFDHVGGTSADGRDSTKDIEFGVFEFVDTNHDGTDEDGNVFFVPLQVDPDDPTKLKDGPVVAYNRDVLDNSGNKLGTISADIPAFMFDGDVKYKLNLGSENQILFNFVYIVDSSGSMAGNNIVQTKAAYQALTQSLIDQGVAEKSRFAVVDFDSFATLFANLNGPGAISVVNSLVASGGTEFGGALSKAEAWYESLNNLKNATNIAFFLSDGFGSGASNSLQLVKEGTPDEAVVDVRAFGIGAGADLSSLNTIDSGNAVLLTNPSDLIDAFSVSGISKDTIDRIDVLVGGIVVDTIAPSELTDDTLGLSFEGTLENLEVTRIAENQIEFRVAFNDGTPTTILNAKITTGQTEVRQQSADGTHVVVNFSVNQASYTGDLQSEIINANDLDNVIDAGAGNNVVKANGGDDRIIVSGGQNIIDGGAGIDTAVFAQTLAGAGGVTKTGDVVSVGADHTLIDVEFIEFANTRIQTSTLTAVPLVSLNPSGVTASEAAGVAAATFGIALSAPAASNVTVSFATRNGSAVAGPDFLAKTGSVLILAGQTQAVVGIDILEDAVVEGDETFFIDFSVSAGATFAGGATTASGAVQIQENDTEVRFVLAASDLDMFEGDPAAPTVKTLTLERAGNLSGEDTIQFTASAAGAMPASAADFIGGFPSGSVTFAAGESVKTFDVAPAPNNNFQNDRTFQIALAAVSGSATVSTTPVAFTIVDDDTDGEAPEGTTKNDFNGDGRGDILWQNADGTPAVWLMNGTGVAAFGPPLSNPTPAWHAKDSGDFNADGKADILWQNDNGSPAIWLMDGTSPIAYGPPLSNLGGPSWHAKAAADFNGDGKADILWQNADGAPAVWLMDGTGVAAYGPALANPGPAWQVKDAADFNGDGKADILWQNDDGTPAIWLMDGTTLAAAGPALANPGPAWHAKEAADFNGDGKADILWQNDDGTPAVWLMEGTNVLAYGAPLPNPGPSWHAKEASDTNGDGKADIIWQNDSGVSRDNEAWGSPQASLVPAVWLMDGTNVAAFGAALSSPGSSWHII